MSNEILNWNEFLNEAKKKKKKKSGKKVSSKKTKTKVINNNYYSSNLGYGLAGIRPTYYLPSSPNIINNNINNNITTGGNHNCDSGMSPSSSSAPIAPTSESVEFKYLKKFSLEDETE